MTDDTTNLVSLKAAKRAAYHHYMLDDANLRDLYTMEVKKELTDGWVFELRLKKPDPTLTVLDNFLALGKDGTTLWVFPDHESAITEAGYMRDLDELQGKLLYDEATSKISGQNDSASEAKIDR